MCADHLDDEGRAEWSRIVAELARRGLLDQTDPAAVALYAATWSRWTHAERAIAERGLVAMSPGGFPTLAPWAAAADRALERLSRFLVAFGLMPAPGAGPAASPPRPRPRNIRPVAEPPDLKSAQLESYLASNPAAPGSGSRSPSRRSGREQKEST